MSITWTDKGPRQAIWIYATTPLRFRISLLWGKTAIGCWRGALGVMLPFLSLASQTRSRERRLCIDLNSTLYATHALRHVIGMSVARLAPRKKFASLTCACARLLLPSGLEYADKMSSLHPSPLAGTLEPSRPLEVSPDISFIVAAFNAAPFVETAVRSALCQTDAEIEVIVVDDASSDGTPDIVAAMADEDRRIKLIRRQSTSGPSVARNTGMAAARGTWMSILDADDKIAPERSRCLLDLAAATSADVVADNFERFWVDGEASGITMMPLLTPPYALLVDLAAFMRGNEMFHPRARLGYVKPMFRTEFMRVNKILHKEDIHIGEDYHLCLSCLLAKARFIVTSQSYYKYRTRKGSLSWRITKEHIDRLLMAHHDLKLQERYAESAEVLAAGRAYAEALEKAGALAGLVDATKHGKWAEALSLIAVRPDLWRLITRFGGAALAKRLTISRSGQYS